MDYELAFWTGLAVATLLFLRIVLCCSWRSQTVSDETLRRLRK